MALNASPFFLSCNQELSHFFSSVSPAQLKKMKREFGSKSGTEKKKISLKSYEKIIGRGGFEEN